MLMETKPNTVAKDILMWKISEDAEFHQKILSDYEFARQQFDDAGVDLSPEKHKDLTAAFSQLEKISKDLFDPRTKLKWVSISAPPISQSIGAGQQ
jgi:hypothetical protein